MPSKRHSELARHLGLDLAVVQDWERAPDGTWTTVVRIDRTPLGQLRRLRLQLGVLTDQLDGVIMDLELGEGA